MKRNLLVYALLIVTKIGLSGQMAIPPSSISYSRYGICAWSLRNSSKLFDTFDYNQAFLYYNAKVRANPPDYESQLLRGISRAHMGDHKGAERDFTDYLNIVPHDKDAYRLRAKARIETEDFEGAISDITELINFTGECVDAYTLRAFAKYYAGDYEGAMDDLEKAEKIDNSNPEIYLCKGLIYIKMEEYSDAITQFDKAVELDPEYADAWYERGMTRQKMGDPVGGCYDLTIARELGHKDAASALRRYCRN